MRRLMATAGLLLALAGCGPAHRHLEMELGEGGRFELTDEFQIEGPAKVLYDSDPSFLYEQVVTPEAPAPPAPPE